MVGAPESGEMVAGVAAMATMVSATAVVVQSGGGGGSGVTAAAVAAAVEGGGGSGGQWRSFFHDSADIHEYRCC